MKYGMLIILFTVISCSNKVVESKRIVVESNVIGLYQHEICKYGPNCFLYEFNPNGTFKYKYWQDILGSDVFTGTWTIKNDTVELIPDNVWFSKQSYFDVSDYEDTSKTLITVNLLRAWGGSLKASWYVSINGSEQYIQTSEEGELLIDNVRIDFIKIRELYQHEFGISSFCCIKDSLFHIQTTKNRININVAECEMQPLMMDWMTTHFILKGDKLYPLTFEPEAAFLQEETYYKRIKKSYNNIKKK